MENFEGFSQLLKEQSDEKSTWACLLFTYTNSNNLKILWLKFSNFLIECLRDNGKVREIVLACSIMCWEHKLPERMPSIFLSICKTNRE